LFGILILTGKKEFRSIVLKPLYRQTTLAKKKSKMCLILTPTIRTRPNRRETMARMRRWPCYWFS